MPNYQFRNLDGQVRTLMFQEFLLDTKEETVYVSQRLKPEAQAKFQAALILAIDEHDNAWLANSIRQKEFWNEYENRHHVTQGIVKSKIPSNAADVLADTEFNKYYMRAICVKAMKAGINDVTVYRARESSRPNPQHEELIGKKINAQALLEQLRKGNTELAMPNSTWISGLSVCLES